MDWTKQRDFSWWADLATVKKQKKGRTGANFKQVDIHALARGVILSKIVQAAKRKDPAEFRDGWIVKTRHAWAQECRVNFSVISLRLGELARVGFITTDRQRAINYPTENLSLAVQVNWAKLEARAADLPEEEAS